MAHINKNVIFQYDPGQTGSNLRPISSGRCQAIRGLFGRDTQMLHNGVIGQKFLLDALFERFRRLNTPNACDR